jgi:hypothetical protein
MTIPIQPERSDADRFATRPKQRKAELVNATDNEMGKLWREARAQTKGARAAPTKAQLKNGEWERLLHVPGDFWEALRLLEEGMWRQWVADDRTLDPETVAEAFTRAEREHSAAVHNRAVIREYGVTP